MPTKKKIEQIKAKASEKINQVFALMKREESDSLAEDECYHDENQEIEYKPIEFDKDFESQEKIRFIATGKFTDTIDDIRNGKCSLVLKINYYWAKHCASRLRQAFNHPDAKNYTISQILDDFEKEKDRSDTPYLKIALEHYFSYNDKKLSELTESEINSTLDKIKITPLWIKCI